MWLTSQYNYLGVANEEWGEFRPFKINIPFGTNQVPTITGQENIQIPLKCEKNYPGYVSIQQCLVDQFINTKGCPYKCVPIQMKGYRY